LLRAPIIRRLIRGADSARFASTLSILTSSGVPLIDALRIAGQVASNLCIRDAVKRASIKVQEGASLHRSLDQHGYFPPMMIQMIASGDLPPDTQRQAPDRPPITMRAIKGPGAVRFEVLGSRSFTYSPMAARLTSPMRSNRLRSSELTDATITVSNLGDLGVETVYGVGYRFAEAGHG